MWRREAGLLLVAVQALTRLPVPARLLPTPFTPDLLRQASRTFPLVGIAVGLLAWAVLRMTGAGFPPLLASLASLAATVLLTGALHEDGLADAADGLLGGRTREDTLRILRDSRVGAFGVLALGLVLGAKVLSVAALPTGSALVASHAAGRFWAVMLPAYLPYARPDGMAAGVASPGPRALGVAAAFGLLPLLLLGARAPLALLLSAAIAFGMARWSRRRLGGYTGDVLGATVVLSDLAILLVAAWHAA